MKSYEVFSDGSGGPTAASACIVQGPVSLNVLAYLGQATNNEAEIFGGLLAFAFIRAQEGDSEVSLSWCSDSEYTLKSATEYIHNWQRNSWRTAQRTPVKNQELWRSYLELTSGWTIVPQHVYGHSGHDENESCDNACTWLRDRSPHALAELFREGHTSFRDREWRILDARAPFQALRAGKGGLVSLFESAPITAPAVDPFVALLKKVRDAMAAAQSLRADLAHSRGQRAGEGEEKLDAVMLALAEAEKTLNRPHAADDDGVQKKR